MTAGGALGGNAYTPALGSMGDTAFIPARGAWGIYCLHPSLGSTAFTPGTEDGLGFLHPVPGSGCLPPTPLSHSALIPRYFIT